MAKNRMENIVNWISLKKMVSNQIAGHFRTNIVYKSSEMYFRPLREHSRQRDSTRKSTGFEEIRDKAVKATTLW